MGSLLQVIWSTLDQQLSHGDHERNLFVLIIQLKPNMLHKLKPPKKSFGFIKYLKTCRRNKWLQRLSLLTTLLQFNWPRIQNSMIEPNISTPNITWFDIMLRPKPFIWRCPTSEQIADIFTKALGHEKFENFRMQLGMSNVPSN